MKLLTMIAALFVLADVLLPGARPLVAQQVPAEAAARQQRDSRNANETHSQHRVPRTYQPARSRVAA